MVIWFGIGETSKILLIYLAIFAPVAMSALAGVKSAQQVRIRAARSLGASRAQVLWLVILPGALPEILTGLRIGLGVGWSTLVAAELIAATRGLGFMVQSAGEFLATDVVLAGIAVIAIIAFYWNWVWRAAAAPDALAWRSTMSERLEHYPAGALYWRAGERGGFNPSAERQPV